MEITKISISSYTNKGMVREHNEDHHSFCPDLLKQEWKFFDHVQVECLSEKGALLILADGMGGTNAGEVASAKAIEGVKHFISKTLKEPINWEEQAKEILTKAILAAQVQIVEHSNSHPDTQGMGTTLVITLVVGSIAYTSWCGDSRCYKWNNESGLIMLSHDHSYVQELVDSGKISPEQAFFHPDSNIITQSLGDSKRAPKPDFSIANLKAGDRLLLCSDGLNSMIQDHAIEKIIGEVSDPVVCAKVLVDEANKAGGHDNTTVIICDIIKCPSYSIPKKKPKRNTILIFTIIITVFALAFGAFYLGKNFSSIFPNDVKQDADAAKTTKETSTIAPVSNGATNNLNDNKLDSSKSNAANTTKDIEESVTEKTNTPQSIYPQNPAAKKPSEKSKSINLFDIDTASVVNSIRKKLDELQKVLSSTDPNTLTVVGSEKLLLQIQNLLKEKNSTTFILMVPSITEQSNLFKGRPKAEAIVTEINALLKKLEK